MKDHGYTYRFYLIIIFFDRTFECGYSEIFKFLRPKKNLQQLTWDHESKNSDIYSKDEQLLAHHFCGK
jgi:hypothetical protein